MKRWITFGVFGLLVVGIWGFQQKPSPPDDPIIARGVEIKVEEFRQKQLIICRDKALKVAITRVDSLIRVRAREQAVEPITKPPKPERPNKPEIRILPDSLDHDSLKQKQE